MSLMTRYIVIKEKLTREGRFFKRVEEQIQLGGILVGGCKHMEVDGTCFYYQTIIFDREA